MKRAIVFFGIVFSLAYQVQAQTFYERMEARKLWEFAKKNNLQSVEALLQSLPVSAKDEWLLGYGSRGLARPSFDYPRVMLFNTLYRDGEVNEDASIVAFSGHPDDPTFNSLEIMEYHQSTERFDFYEISFPLSDTPPEANPPQCASCHGKDDPRPIWDPYPVWPGISVSATDRTPWGASKVEAEKMAWFISNLTNLDRYKELSFQWVPPSAPGELPRIVTGSLQFNFPSEYSAKYWTANKFFKEGLFYLNERRVARMLSERLSDPNLSKLRFAIYGFAKCITAGGSAPKGFPFEWFPEEHMAAFEYSYEEIRADTQKRNHDIYVENIERQARLLGTPVPPYPEEQPIRDLIKLRYILENHGIGMKGWSTTLKEDSYAFRYSYLHIPFRILKRAIQSRMERDGIISADEATLSCEELKQQSVAQFQ